MSTITQMRDLHGLAERLRTNRKWRILSAPVGACPVRITFQSGDYTITG